MSATSYRSRATLVALLLIFAIIVAGCGDGQSAQQGESEGTGEQQPAENTTREATSSGEGAGYSEEQLSEAAESATPEADGEYSVPEMRDWNDPGSQVDATESSSELVSSGSSTGAVPAVKPFNFGQDPGGPEDKTLSLTVPKLGIEDLEIHDSVEEEKLHDSAVHVPATGFPWQEGANTFIAGHRIGYPDTDSFRVFYDLPKLEDGDEIIVEDANGGEYVYQVTKQEVVGPQNVEVMNPVEGENVLSLQTCTLPDYEDRIVVQAEMVEGDTTQS